MTYRDIDKNEEATEIVDGLRQATDQQLEEIFQRSKRMLREDDYLKIDYEDLVELVALRFHLLVYNEQVRRRNILTGLKADLQGGHDVTVWMGNDPGKFAAYCDPRPDDDSEYCWTGSDRDSIEEAVADGRRHHPGYEPELEVPLDLG